MIDWECTIKGFGPVHGGSFSADQMLSKVTADLADAGHHIVSAMLSHSGGAGIHDLVAAPTHKGDKMQGGDDDFGADQVPEVQQPARPADPGDADVGDLTQGDADQVPVNGDGDDEELNDQSHDQTAA